MQNKRPLPDKFYAAAPNKNIVKIKPQFLASTTTSFQYQNDDLDLPFTLGEAIPYDLSKAFLIKNTNEKIPLSDYLKSKLPFNAQTIPSYESELRTSVVFVPKDKDAKGHYQMAVKSADIKDAKKSDEEYKYLFAKVTLKPVLEEKNTFRLYDNQEAVFQWVDDPGLPASDNCFTATSLPDAQTKQLIQSKKKEDKKKIADVLDGGVLIVSATLEFKVDLVEKAKEAERQERLEKERIERDKQLAREREEQIKRMQDMMAALPELSRDCHLDSIERIECLMDKSERLESLDSISYAEKSFSFKGKRNQRSDAKPIPAPHVDENAIITSNAIQMNYRSVSYGAGSYSLIGKLQAQFIQGISCPADESVVEQAMSHAVGKINHTTLIYDNNFILFNEKYLGALLITAMPKEMLLLTFNYLLNDKNIFHNFQTNINLSEHIARTHNPMVAKATLEVAQKDSGNKNRCVIS
jgi:hypothetical protein